MCPRPQIFLILLIALLQASCTPWIRTEQGVRTGFAPLSDGESLGQTFSARYAGLAGVAVFLRPEEQDEGSLTLNLRRGPLEAENLRQASVRFEQITQAGYYRFDFAPLRDSTRQDFYFQLEADGPGTVSTGHSAPGEYLNGAMYQDGLPVEAQVAFRLIYDPWLAALGLLAEAVTGLALLLAGAFLFLLPGWALLLNLFPGWSRLSLAERLGLSAGTGLALYPLLFLWTGLVSLHLGPLYAWLPPLVALGFILWGNFTRRSAKDNRSPVKGLGIIPSPGLEPTKSVFHRLTFADGTLLLVLALVFAVRFWAVRGLEAPMLGDGYQHTLIAQLLVDHGGLFDSWLPYADLQTFTYHFGFHTAAAAFHWVTRLPLPQAVLWVGQVLNGLAVLSLYPLAAKIGRNPWAGVFAVLVAGLLSPAPMVYANWSRYTQLAGQVILAPAVYLLWTIVETRTWSWRSLGLAWLVLGGLALTHYRVLVFAMLFFAALLWMSLRRDSIRPLVLKTVWIGTGAGLLFLPWFIHIYAGKILRIFASQVSTPAAQVAAFTREYNAIGDLTVYLPAFLWALLALAAGWAIWRRERGAILVALWWLLNLLAANPQWLGLPGAGAVGSFAVLIAAYFPAGILIGACAVWLLEELNRRGRLTGSRTRESPLEPGNPDRPRGESDLEAQEAGRRKDIPSTAGLRAGPILLFLLALGTGLWGARLRLRDLQPANFALVTSADRRAAAWIQANTSPRAKFLVNAFFAFGDTTVAGSDAGWWLPLLARRETTLPPINYAFEVYPTAGSLPLINALTAEIQAKGIQHPEVVNRLDSLGVTHVYIGQQQGRVNYSGPVTLDPQQLLASGYYKPVYHQDRVWVFEVLP